MGAWLVSERCLKGVKDRSSQDLLSLDRPSQNALVNGV